eukprot:TRINITY_DN122175_c0_g1_i1.p1 TRINITY_DN122175_c0_g1~~TRINITY_DN122175_c0_g1_i1.p1  ORF type:complete len:668 (-),score=165.08 TRINITY_DN122175_c0_g1_i1:78-2081(-)
MISSEAAVQNVISKDVTKQQRLTEWYGSTDITYGTFPADGSLGLLVEVNRYLGDFQLLIWLYVVTAVFLSLVWPISWLVGLAIGGYAYLCAKSDWLSTSFNCIFATLLGLAISIWPGIVMSLSSKGLWYWLTVHVWEEMDSQQMSPWDLQGPWKAQTIMLMLFYFCVTYQNVNSQIVDAKKQMMPHLGSGNRVLALRKHERVRFEGAYAAISQDREHRRQEAEHNDVMKLMKILDTMPGWSSPNEEGAEEYGDDLEARSFFRFLRSQQEAAKKKSLFALDIYTVHQYRYTYGAGQLQIPRQTRLSLYHFLKAATRKSTDVVRRTYGYVFEYLVKSPLTAIAVLLLTLPRVLIPRLWLKYYLGGAFLPSQFSDLCFVVVSNLLMFIASFFLLSLFVVMTLDYAKNAHQAYLLSALVNMEARQVYARYTLVDYYGLEPEEAEAELVKLPLLDLRRIRNVVAFWELRNFLILDRANDRAGMQILITTGLMLLTFNTVLAFYDMYVLPYIPPMVPMVIYDLVVMGSLIIYALHVALQMNFWMGEHAKYFTQARHDAIIEAAGLQRGELHDDQLTSGAFQWTRISQELLDSTINVVTKEPREALLFGMEVTPAKIISLAVSFLAAAGSIFYEMFQSGVDPIPDTYRYVTNGTAHIEGNHSAAVSFARIFLLS